MNTPQPETVSWHDASPLARGLAEVFENASSAGDIDACEAATTFLGMIASRDRETSRVVASWLVEHDEPDLRLRAALLLREYVRTDFELALEIHARLMSDADSDVAFEASEAARLGLRPRS